MIRKLAAAFAVVGVLGIGIAFVSACGSQASSSSGTAGDPQAAVVGTGSTAGASTVDPLVTDPAKQEPLLDKFTSKDPFFDNNISTPSVASSATPSPSSSATPSIPTSHSMTLTQVGTKNGLGSATFLVDGKTYSDKIIGSTFSTSWGQIKVLKIDVGAKTVTILHGDSSLTLNEGQSVTSG